MVSTGGPYGGGSLGVGAGSVSVAGGGGGSGTVSGPGGLRVVSSFGADQTSLTKFRARSFIKSERVVMLARRESYYRCVAHGERVILANGGELPIEEVVPGTDVQATHAWQHVAAATAFEAVRTGRKQVIELTTRSGRKLRVTDEHPVLAAVDAAFGWVRAGRLREGDHVATPRFLAAGNSHEWSAEQAALLGYFAGDGHCGRGSASFTQLASPAVARRFDELASDLGGVVKWKDGRASVSGVELLRLAERAGLVHQRSHEKRVPMSLFACSQDALIAFLAALWDCDGSVNERVGLALLSTTSEQLARDVQSLLLRVGIWARVSHRAQSREAFGDRDLCVVEVTGEDAREFGRVVGPTIAHEEKARRALAWADVPVGKNLQTDVVPTAWRGLLSGRNQHRRFAAAPSGNVTRATLSRIADVDANDDLHALATSDVRWDRVERIEQKGEEWVYDLTVPGADSFVASGCYVHNCTSHDWKMFDFDGRMIKPGPPTSQPMLSAETASWYVPLKLRRPTSPYRLARVITASFTSLLFGHGRWPTIRCHGDLDTEDFIAALAQVTGMRTLMIRARNIGGSVGTVGISWRFYDGKPIVQVHNGKHLYVHSWIDREACIPEHVTECYTFPRDEHDPKKGKIVRKWYWYRRDWTPVADIVFEEAEYKNDRDPDWVIDTEKTVYHEDGKTHFVWVQNLPEDDGTSIDGQPDYAELYENFDAIDVVKSVTVRGATLNLDPTLILKLDPDIVQRTGIKKGSDNSLVVGESGDAHYMELGGSSIQVGLDLFQKMRVSALEVAQCVIPDPNAIGSAAHSSPALKVIYEPMLSKAEVLREQYGAAIIKLIADMTDVARRRLGEIEIQIDEEGNEVEIRPSIDLPPRYETVEEIDPETHLMVEVVHEVERDPGNGGSIELLWGEYFNPTADDQSKTVATLTQATAGKILSRETAAQEIADTLKINPRAEWKRINGEIAAEKAEQAAMFADQSGAMGGEVPPTDEQLPPGDQALTLTATDLASITTVDEGRFSVGLPPLRLTDGTPDPDGALTILEFRAKKEAKGGAAGRVVGQVEGQVETGQDQVPVGPDGQPLQVPVGPDGQPLPPEMAPPGVPPPVPPPGGAPPDGAPPPPVV